MHKTHHSLVEIKNLCHYYSKGDGADLLVLDEINLTLYEHEIVCLLGHSGAGKSTLLRTVSGLIKPTQGSVIVKGKKMHGPRKGVAMVFQNFALFPWLTILDNVAIGLETQNIQLDDSQRRAKAALELMGLEGHDNSYPRELSGGMQQRVGLARAVVVKPFLLLMDEPFSALDVLTAETLRRDFLKLWHDKQLPTKSILIVTHNIEEAVEMADRIIILGSNPGRIIAEIPVTLAQPRERTKAGFNTLVNKIFSQMMEKGANAEEKEELIPSEGINMYLPHIVSSTLRGFMETLAAMPYAKSDLQHLSTKLHMDYKEIFEIAETLRMLDFCAMDGAEVSLNAAGNKFVKAAADQRRKLFCNHLKAHIPLATYIHQVLEKQSNHSEALNSFIKELEQNMPATAASDTINAVISWARYADLFAYNEKTGKFSLEQ